LSVAGSARASMRVVGASSSVSLSPSAIASTTCCARPRPGSRGQVGVRAARAPAA
jgi:hypothetical protein